jgi:tetratricopeptide (TPR) repeat protein
MRGLGHACSKDLIKSINEFSICTSLDKNYAPAYVQRAKCLFLLGDTDKAFMDLHSYMELESKDMGIHKWIGDLLYESKSYNDALKTYCEMEDTY